MKSTQRYGNFGESCTGLIVLFTSRLFWYAVCESVAVIGMAVYVLSVQWLSIPLMTVQFAGIRTSNILYKDRSQIQSLMHGSIHYSPGHMSLFHSLQTYESTSSDAQSLFLPESGVFGRVLLRSAVINATLLHTRTTKD